MSPAGRTFRQAFSVEDSLLLGAAVLLPWVFGGVLLWSYRLAGLLLFASAAVAVTKRGFAGLGLDRDRLWLLPAGLLAAWAAFQVVPLPPAAIRVLSPAAHEIYRQSFPGYPGGAPGDVVGAIEADALSRVSEARDVPAPGGAASGFRPAPSGRWSGFRTLSLHPAATVERLLWYAALLLGFLVARQRTTDLDGLRRYRATLFALFAALAAFALVQRVTWNGRIYWVGEKLEAARPFGPYVDGAHFAALMEIAVPWLVGYVAARLRRQGWVAMRRPEVVLAAAAGLLSLAAGIAAGSRAAGVLIVATLTVMVVAGVPGRRTRPAVIVGVIVLWGVVGGLAYFTDLGARTRDLVASRGGVTAVSRIEAWKSVLPMVADYPATGVGIGAFRQVFPRYLPRGEAGRWSQLHDDYLEFLAEGGAIAGLLALWLVWGFARRSARAFAGARASSAGLSRVGLLLGLLSVAAHAFVDFSLQIPADALVFVVAAALALSPLERRTA